MNDCKSKTTRTVHEHIFTTMDLLIIVSLNRLHRDKMFPAFGFGAQISPSWQVSSVLWEDNLLYKMLLKFVD